MSAMTGWKAWSVGLVVAAAAGLAGCGGAAEHSGVSEGSRFAGEFKDAPSWVRTQQCGGDAVKNPDKMVCGVGDHAIVNRASIGLSRRAAAATARSAIARNLSAQVNSLLEKYSGEYTAGDEAGSTGETEGRTREAIEEISKMPLSGAQVVDSWISSSDTMYVLVALDHDKAMDAIKKNAALSARQKAIIDANAQEMFDTLRGAE
jgi:hypothetical protein